MWVKKRKTGCHEKLGLRDSSVQLVSSKGFDVVLCSYQFFGLWEIRGRWGEIGGRKMSLEDIIRVDGY